MAKENNIKEIKSLTPKQKAALKGMAHSLKPCVVVGGQGVSPGVLAELTQALDHHELVKVQLPGSSPAQEKTQLLEELAKALGPQTHVVQRIGRMVVLYKVKTKEPVKIPLASLGS